MSKDIYRIGVDCDLTIVDTFTPWVEGFNLAHSEHPDFRPITAECIKAFPNIDFTGLFLERMREMANPRRINPMEFWRNPTLYDELVPLHGTMTFMDKLRTRLEPHFSKVEFVIVTKCEPEHERSKRRFVERHFDGYFAGFVSTGDKHLVGIDMLVDDNPSYVEPCYQNGIFQIYVPQNNVWAFDYPKDDLAPPGHLTVLPDPNYVNHFGYLNENIDGVAEMLLQFHKWNN